MLTSITVLIIPRPYTRLQECIKHLGLCGNLMVEGGGRRGVWHMTCEKSEKISNINICVNPIWYIDNVIVSRSQGCSFLEFLPQFVTDWLLCLPVSVIGFPYFFEKRWQFGRKWKWKLFYVFKQRPQDFYTGIITGFPQANFECMSQALTVREGHKIKMCG